jgi:formylglycine-generating enzyme required for sulfatase activity
MKIKNIVTVLLVAYILVACAPEMTLVPPTEMFTSVPILPTATLTLTPIPTSIINISSTMISEDGATLVYVPEGEFTMGSDMNLDEQPIHKVKLDAFWIDQFEVTNEQYAACVSSGGCTPPSNTSSNTRSSYYGNFEFDKFPVIYVSWNDAVAYCEWAGRRLPTEAEWEKAARGTDQRTYPWGNDSPNNDLLNFNNSIGDTTKVGNYPNGASPYGALDMAGNVWEWVNDWYQNDYYASLGDSVSNPQGPLNGDSKVLRGSSWSYSYNFIHSAIRQGYNPSVTNARHLNIGFRCARSLP